MEPKSSYERRFHRGMFGRSFGFATVWRGRGVTNAARPARARSPVRHALFWFVCLPPPPRHVYGAERRLLLTYLLVAANMKTDEVDK